MTTRSKGHGKILLLVHEVLENHRQIIINDFPKIFARMGSTLFRDRLVEWLLPIFYTETHHKMKLITWNPKCDIKLMLYQSLLPFQENTTSTPIVMYIR